ncbi:21776_t:CDS:2 [Entrophospora sp. SA101]|nr:21776_t:CDS:2 [Entrophospora sp. SA101]
MKLNMFYPELDQTNLQLYTLCKFDNKRYYDTPAHIKSLDNATESENFSQIWNIIKKYIDEYGIKGGGQNMNKNCLNLFTIKDMAKIRYYLYLNIKNELNYESKEKSEKEPRSLVQGNDSDDKELEIPNEEVYVLIVNEMVDLNNQHLMRIMMI